MIDVPCDAVISPAMGGIIVGHEVGRALDKRHIFAEKEDGKLVLRRNFEIESGQKFLVVEDVITHGEREACQKAAKNSGSAMPMAT